MIHTFSEWLTHSLFRLEEGSSLGESVLFFLNDSILIILLLLVLTHAMSLLRYYLPVYKIRKFLGSHKFYGLDYFFAAVFGAVTPFCSCSSIPLFISFVEARIPMGVTFAFLITSPLVNEVAVGILAAAFGWRVAVLYVGASMLIGMVGGFIISRFNVEKYLESYLTDLASDKFSEKKRTMLPFGKIIKVVSKEARKILRKIVPYVLVGIALGAFIHGFVPAGYFEGYLENAGIFGVPLAVILAVPMYSTSGVIPIVQALVAKGVPLGTALAFMMAIVGLSLPEALILKRVMKWKLLGIFFGVVTIGIILIGYLFNLVY